MVKSAGGEERRFTVTVTVQPFFSGIALDVTPEISAEGEVILHVHPTVSEVSQQNKIIAGQSVPLAASTIRESDSIVRAQSGQIIVIGGLMQPSEGSVDVLGKPVRGPLPRDDVRLMVLVDTSVWIRFLAGRAPFANERGD
jgi:MSHA biogenesis protein MshL